MKIKRFIAPNMREAMRLVREEQGPDAVILSNRRLEHGIEVVAATDYDAALIQRAAVNGETVTAPAISAPMAPVVSEPVAAVASVSVSASVTASAPVAPVLAFAPRAVSEPAPLAAAPRIAGVPPMLLRESAPQEKAEARELTRPVVFPRLERVERPAASSDLAASVMATAAAIEPVAPVAAAPALTSVETPAPVAAAISAPAVLVRPEPSELEQLKAEMQTMRRFVTEQMGRLQGESVVPAAPAVRSPIRADVVRALVNLGVDTRLAREIATEIPEGWSADRARIQALGLLARRIPAFKHEWLDAGGVVALVGATGVGKTTTIAKLAARYIQHWGLRDVALVTTDHFRIGAQEQLFTYGRLLGVPVLTADNQHELCLALDKLRDRKLVLIDTAGMSPRDANLEKQFAMLSGLPVPNRTALVLSASSQASDLEAQFERFAPADPGAVILTKLDEASLPGVALSAVVRRQLPLAYVTDGQRVPEDLAPARPEQLVTDASAAAAARLRAPVEDEAEDTAAQAGAVHA